MIAVLPGAIMQSSAEYKSKQASHSLCFLGQIALSVNFLNLIFILLKIKVKILIIAPRRLRQYARGVGFYDSLGSDINVSTKRNLLDKNSQVALVTTSMSLPSKHW